MLLLNGIQECYKNVTQLYIRMVEARYENII